MHQRTLPAIVRYPSSCRGRGCSRNEVTSLPLPLDDDEDVRAERLKVTSDDRDSEILRMNGLSRVYRTNLGRSRRVAVNQLCLRVNKGEVCVCVCVCGVVGGCVCVVWCGWCAVWVVWFNT